MMARYIDADALVKELEREVELADDWKTAHEIANVVKYFPTTEIEPRRAFWVGKPIAGYATVRCANCRAVFNENKGRWPYCPNCGAKMDFEEIIANYRYKENG